MRVPENSPCYCSILIQFTANTCRLFRYVVKTEVIFVMNGKSLFPGARMKISSHIHGI